MGEAGERRDGVALEAATGEPLGTAALGSAADIDKAVRAAREAFDHGPWGRTTVAERVEAMGAFAAALRSRAEATSELCSREMGMPIGLSKAFNGEAPAALLDFYAGQVQGMEPGDGAGEPEWARPWCAASRSGWSARSPLGTTRSRPRW